MIGYQWNLRYLLKHLIISALLLNAVICLSSQSLNGASAPQVSFSQLKSKDPIIADETLTTGWYEFDPYYTLIKDEGGVEFYSGLDAEMARAIASTIGYKVSLHPRGWEDQLTALKDGSQHFAPAATETEERKKFVYFSDSYRREENSFFC